MQRDKLLVISPRVPDFLESTHDKRFYYIIKALSQKYQVHFLFFQSMFIKEGAIRKIKKLGVKIINIRDRKQKQFPTLEKWLESLLKIGRYKIILFNTYFTAKHYLPYLNIHSPESILVIDAGRSQYLLEINFAKRCKDIYQKANLLRNAEISKEREFPTYNHVDMVIIDNEDGLKDISAEIPNVPIGVIPSFSTEVKDNKIISQKTISIFSKIKKKKMLQKKTNISIIKTSSKQMTDNCLKSIKTAISTGDIKLRLMEGKKDYSLVEKYNLGLKNISEEYVLISIDNIIFPEYSIKRMLFCAETHPNNGIIIPVSNITLGSGITSYENLVDFIPKHYISNFGNWKKVKQIREFCMLIKKGLLDKIGLLDEKFTTIIYAEWDFCLRAFQVGYKTIVAQDIFIYYCDFKADRSKDLEEDRRLLINKWCNKGTEFLEGLND